MSGSRSVSRIAALVSCLALATWGCASQAVNLPLAGSGDLAVGVSGDPHVEVATKSASTFPTEEARTALAAAERGLKACRTGPAPVAVDATLEFAPSGKVHKLKVAPAKGEVAECVRADLAQIEIPEFEGPPVSMEMRTVL